jgi:hypothetical protein
MYLEATDEGPREAGEAAVGESEKVIVVSVWPVGSE